MALNYFELHLTHVLLGLIFGAVIVAITALELYYIVVSNIPVSSTDLLYITSQNIGIAIANSYYRSKVSLTQSGLQESTQTPRETAGNNPP